MGDGMVVGSSAPQYSPSGSLGLRPSGRAEDILRQLAVALQPPLLTPGATPRIDAAEASEDLMPGSGSASGAG